MINPPYNVRIQASCRCTVRTHVIALAVRKEFLLPIIAGVFLAENVSVILDVKEEPMASDLLTRLDDAAMLLSGTSCSISKRSLLRRGTLVGNVIGYCWCQFGFKFVSYFIKMIRLESGVDEVVVTVNEAATKICII